jgi:hypothetical protein
MPPTDSPTRASNATQEDRWPDVKAGNLIFSGTDYIIYIDDNGEFNWQTSKKYDALMAPQPTTYDHNKSNSIINQSELLQAMLSEGLPPPVKRQAYDLIGAALTSCFEFDYASAEQMLATAQKFIETRNEEIARYWYLSATFVTAALVALISLAAFLIARDRSLVAGDEWWWWSLACALGAVGALLSVISRTGRLSFDPAAGKKLHYLEAAARIVAGSLSGVIVYGAVKSGIILSGQFKDNDKLAVALLSAFAGGAGERLMSTVLGTFDSVTSNKPAPAAPARPAPIAPPVPAAVPPAAAPPAAPAIAPKQ